MSIFDKKPPSSSSTPKDSDDLNNLLVDERPKKENPFQKLQKMFPKDKKNTKQSSLDDLFDKEEDSLFFGPSDDDALDALTQKKDKTPFNDFLPKKDDQSMFDKVKSEQKSKEVKENALKIEDALPDKKEETALPLPSAPFGMDSLPGETQEKEKPSGSKEVTKETNPYKEEEKKPSESSAIFSSSAPASPVAETNKLKPASVRPKTETPSLTSKRDSSLSPKATASLNGASVARDNTKGVISQIALLEKLLATYKAVDNDITNSNQLIKELQSSCINMKKKKTVLESELGKIETEQAAKKREIPESSDLADKSVKQLNQNNDDIKTRTCFSVVKYANKVSSNISKQSGLAEQHVESLGVSYKLLKVQVGYTRLLEKTVDALGVEEQLLKKRKMANHTIATLAQHLLPVKSK